MQLVDQSIYQRQYQQLNNSSNEQNRTRPQSQGLMSILNDIAAIFIKQKFEALEVITQFETENAYFIFAANPYNQQPQNNILNAYEKSGMLVRNIMPEYLRSFHMEVKDPISGNSVFYMKRPQKCTFFKWGRPVMTVHGSSDNDLIGSITIPMNCCSDYVFVVNDSQDNLLYTITGNCCQCSLWCKLPCNKCQSTTFTIFDYKGEGVGVILKKSAGFLKSLVSDCDNFYVKFPENIPVFHKPLLIATSIFIDYWLFEGKVQRNAGGK